MNLYFKVKDMKTDKLLHFLSGFFIASVTTSLLGLVFGIIISALVATGKEIIYDELLEKGTRELGDFIATVGGILIWIGTYNLLI